MTGHDDRVRIETTHGHVRLASGINACGYYPTVWLAIEHQYGGSAETALTVQNAQDLITALQEMIDQAKAADREWQELA